MSTGYLIVLKILYTSSFKVIQKDNSLSTVLILLWIYWIIALLKSHN